MSDSDGNINVFVSTFVGLHLPRTLNLPLPPSLCIREVSRIIRDRLPQSARHALTITTNSNRELEYFGTESLGDVVCRTSRSGGGMQCLPLRVTSILVGGKGGFGSQLRAAGGRMSSKKKRQNAELATGSARNLDGRRLRTITEAKNLAAYLATKPDMDRKEKEERRKRWEQVIDLAEQREADMRAGKTADGRRKGLSEDWIVEKEEVGESVKNAVKQAMADPEDVNEDHNAASSESPVGSADEDSADEEPMQLDEGDMAKLRKEAEAGDTDALWVLQNKLKIPAPLLPKAPRNPPQYIGFDDDLSSDDDDDDVVSVNEGKPVNKGKAVVRNP